MHKSGGLPSVSICFEYLFDYGKRGTQRVSLWHFREVSRARSRIFRSGGEANQLKADSGSDDDRVVALLLAERRALEMIADGAALADVLEELCRVIDEQQPDVITSFSLMDVDGQRLWPAVGPRVPAGWTKAITPLQIAPEASSCGTVVFRKQPVIVSDIATDPLFALPDHRSLALSHGLRAVWYQPFISSDGEMLGSFAMYYREPREPSDGDLQLISRVAHLAMIAVQRDRAQKALECAYQEIKQSEEKLRRDEEELRRITDLIPHAIIVLIPDGRVIYANRWVLEYTGLSPEEMQAEDFRSRVFHPDDVRRVREERIKSLSGTVPFENEQRALGKDGKYRWFLWRYNPLLDEGGKAIRWYVTGTDIDERKRAEDHARNESVALREEIARLSMFEEIVGSSAALREVLAQIARVAPSDSTVLILGETGTGKELIARAIHKRSKRAARAFIGVNCGAIPTSLIASELFGHEKGAFTGATQKRLGRFEAAQGGTIFLDEVGDLPPDIQIALLRVLQEREIERVGSDKTLPVDVRVLAATHRDLEKLVSEGKFRQDLLYRLNVVPIEMPSLRERATDIPLLVEYFIDRFGRKAGKKFRTIEKQTLKLLQAYEWPGNVRELQNVIERAVILSDSDNFAVDETWLKREQSEVPRPKAALSGALVKQEREMIEAALAESHGRVSGPAGAAARLGLPTRTLDSKIKRLGIDKYRFKSQSH